MKNAMEPPWEDAGPEPSGMLFFDKKTGGVPSGSVMLVHGGPVTTRAAIGLKFAAAGSSQNAPSLIIGGGPGSLSPRMTSGEDRQRLAALDFPPTWIETPQDSLTPSDAVRTWRAVRSAVAEQPPPRVVLNQSDAWFSFVPDHLVKRSADLLLQELRSMSSRVMVMLPDPLSQRALLVLDALAEGCDMRIRLVHDRSNHKVHWVTEAGAGEGLRQETEIDEHTAQEITAQEMTSQEMAGPAMNAPAMNGLAMNGLAMNAPAMDARGEPDASPAPKSASDRPGDGDKVSFSRLMNLNSSDLFLHEK